MSARKHHRCRSEIHAFRSLRRARGEEDEYHADRSAHHRLGARSALHQHHPHSLHGCRAAGQIRTSRHADGACSAGLHPLEPGNALRSGRPHLAQSRPFRPLQRPRLDAAVVRAAPHQDASGECRLRDARKALGHPRRHPALPPVGLKGPRPRRVSLGLGG